MLGHLVNNSGTSFGQRGENNDVEIPSAPTSLSSVPSFGTEEWRHFRFNALTDTSTTSASPTSSSFPGFASSNSSAIGGTARSYSTTPLSSTSIEIPRSSWPLLLETSSQVQVAELDPQKYTKFILEDPTVAKQKKDKAMRACTLCFTKRLECSESETPNRCLHCFGKSSYCKGPIETPRLFDLEWLDAMVAALLEFYYQSIGLHLESQHFGTLQVDLKLKLSPGQDVVSDSQTHSIQLPGQRDDFRFLYESSNLDGILDAILSADVPLCMAPKSGLYDLSVYELLCRRFCACMSLLHRLNECTLDKTYKNDHTAVHVVVGFVCQLARTASSAFTDIFEHLRRCCFTNRDRRGTPKLMFVLAEHLGHMHAEMRLLMDVKGQYHGSFHLSGLFHDIAQNLDGLQKLGRGLCGQAFESTSRSPALSIAAIHLVPYIDPCHYSSSDEIYNLSQHISFLDVLREFTSYQHPSGGPPVPTMYNDDTAGSWQNVSVEDAELIVGHESQDGNCNSQDMINENYLAFEVKGLQAEANAMLNLEWTLKLDDFAVSQSKEASIGTDHFHCGTLDPTHYAHYVGWERQSNAARQAGDAYLQSTGPEYTDIDGAILTSLFDSTMPSQAQSSNIQRVEPANNRAFSHSTKPLCSLPGQPPRQIPNRASKRKRIKSALSRKKPRLAPSHQIQNEDSSALIDDSSSKPIPHIEAARITTDYTKMSSKQPSGDSSTEYPRVYWTPAQEQRSNGRTKFDSAGIVRDIKISESERRPMSWPDRNPWRKSLDISVAVLTKRFEKLMTERGETSPLAI